MYKRDDLGIVKSVERKANGLSEESQGRNIQYCTEILHSVAMLVFKNTKWPTCVYMIKHITQTVVIYF